MEITRDFAVTVYIVHQGKILLHLHKKLKCWLPVGGHIDTNELPHTAALREVKEESGLEVELWQEKKPFIFDESVSDLPTPEHILLEDINPGHQHIDLAYFATAKTTELKPEEGEATDLRWFSDQELDELTNVKTNALLLAKQALKIIK